MARSLVVPVDEGDETRFRLLEPVRQLAAEKLAARARPRPHATAHTQWYLELFVQLGERWRAGDDQGSWPIAARELPNLQAAFDHLVETGRIDDAQQFAVAGFGPVDIHFDTVPLFDWAPRAASLDPAHVGPFTASVCAMAAWGPLSRGDLEAAAAWLRRGAPPSNRDPATTASSPRRRSPCGVRWPARGQREFLQRSADEAMRSSDLHRQVWVSTYSGPAEEAVAAARARQQVLLALRALERCQCPAGR